MEDIRFFFGRLDLREKAVEELILKSPRQLK